MTPWGLQKVDEALRYYMQALTILEVLDYERCARLYYQVASIYKYNGNTDEAYKNYLKGAEFIEKVRSSIGLSEMKSSYLNKIFSIYEDVALFMFANNYQREAFAIMEKMRARVFLDQLAENSQGVDKGISPALKQKKIELQIRIRELQNKQGLMDYNADVTKLTEDLHQSEAEYETLVLKIRRKNPLYASVHYPEPVKVEVLRQSVLRYDEALLEYFVSDNETYCFVITRDSFKATRLGTTKQELEELVKACVADARDNATIKNGNFNTTHAVKLYRLLISPVEKQLAGKKLIIAPDEALCRLPFELLVRKGMFSSKFLIEEYDISYIQSATVLEYLRTQYRDKSAAAGGFIGFGDPVYKKEEDRLEGTAVEISQAAAQFKTKDLPAQEMLRERASKENALSPQMQQYGYIHFAAHTHMENKIPSISLSQLSDSPEDGLLTMQDLMNCSYNARLVVLSACLSGRGVYARGEGVIGLTRAVMYAGSPAVAVTLWKINDAATPTLI